MQVLSADTNNTRALFTLGQLYSDSLFSQPIKAIELFTRVLELEPAHQEAMMALAKVFTEEGRCKEAMTVVDRLLKMDPKHADTAREILETC
jgi:cytochrome c-type biogenesis protein CcmH/NrfG